MGNEKKISPNEVGLEIGLVLSKFFFKTEHLHFGYWPDDLEITIDNLKKSQDYHSKKIIEAIPDNVNTILDVGSGSGGLAEKLIKNKKDISLTVVGSEKREVSNYSNQSNVKILQTQASKLKLIKHYDDHNIFVLPSYTEGHPMVVLEALARRRPVIVFEDIQHIIAVSYTHLTLPTNREV